MKIWGTDNYCCDRCGLIKQKSELSELECYQRHEVCKDCRTEISKVLFDKALLMSIMPQKGKHIPCECIVFANSRKIEL